MKKLTITCYSRVKWGDKSPCMASSFMRELDRNWVQQFTWDELRNAPVSQEEANRIDRLRALLGRS